MHTRILETACFQEDLATIQRDIREQNLNRVVIAACSNRTHDSLFQRTIRQAGLNPFLVELVNLREQCSRVHYWQRELANRKAQELVRVAIGRSGASQPVYKKKFRCYPAALVIGGGVSGMTAALAIADSGYEVHLIERSEMLGGNLSKLHYVAEGYNPQILLRDLVNRVRAHQRVIVHTRSDVLRHTGHVGRFGTELITRSMDGSTSRTQFEHGVTIVATGVPGSASSTLAFTPGDHTARAGRAHHSPT
jgi:heterodisulfide reductase subunit A